METIEISKQTAATMLHIIEARLDEAFAEDNFPKYSEWFAIKTFVEYLLDDNLECLRQFDHMPTAAEREAERRAEEEE